jgi:hypothetical protein
MGPVAAGWWWLRAADGGVSGSMTGVDAWGAVWLVHRGRLPAEDGVSVGMLE